mgnify:CR=1 FL=1
MTTRTRLAILGITAPVLAFAVVGGLMGKIRPNWFVGIRTPWTLTSKVAWVRTHRLGGWLFVAQGLLFVLSGLALLPFVGEDFFPSVDAGQFRLHVRTPAGTLALVA